MNDTFTYKSLHDFVRANCNRVFRYWIYRRSYTPYEQEHKFMDESIYEDICCNTAYIKECIELPNGDFLLGFLDANRAEDGEFNAIQYCKLSEIRLEYTNIDQEDYEAQTEEGEDD